MAEADRAAQRAIAHPVKAKDIERLVAALEHSPPTSDIEQARVALRGIFGSINVVSDEREVRLATDLRDTHRALLEGVGASANLVAGACFELYSAYPIQVPAVPASVFATR